MTCTIKKSEGYFLKICIMQGHTSDVMQHTARATDSEISTSEENTQKYSCFNA
jgi:hypothetical protein